jgi:hypothetical protein
MIVLYSIVFVDQIKGFYLINLLIVKLSSFDLQVNVDDQLKEATNLDMDLYLLLL